MRTYLTTMASPLGALHLIRNDDGLRRIAFDPVDEGSFDERVPPERCPVARQLAEYFAGERRSFDLTLVPEGTAFQRRVWRALQDIPYGETTSYGTLAAQLGRARASRAVGAANGQNPIPIVIPCHRVISGRGALTGYAGGLNRKRALLDLEARFAFGR